jgi:hypothetical protein
MTYTPSTRTRTVTVKPDHSKVISEDSKQGNLEPYMHITDRLYKDAKSARKTMSQMYQNSETNYYKDREQTRLMYEREGAEIRQHEQDRQNAEMKHEKEMAVMKYKDRVDERNNQMAMELKPVQMEYNDRQSQRQHVENMARLDRAEELSRIAETSADNAQRRHHEDLLFRDSRVGRHEKYVKLTQEQHALDRIAESREIFKLMLDQAPDEINLRDRRVSPQRRLLNRQANHLYEYSFMVTGVDYIDRSNPESPTVVFLDGSQLILPEWGNGYTIVDKRVETYSYVIHVYRLSHPMQWKDKSHNEFCCCNKCNVQ